MSESYAEGDYNLYLPARDYKRELIADIKNQIMAGMKHLNQKS